MSAVPAAAPAEASAGAAPAPAARRWLVGPWFDALLVANVAWPLFALAQAGDGFDGRAGLQFWQVYYVTTPHRWITLLIVFLDRERFRRRRGLFVGIAVCAAAVALGVRLTTGTLTCLLAVDYLWNAWHFAAQHHGIYRIYGRLGNSAPATGAALEKWALRGFLLYVTFRVASATWPHAGAEGFFGACDGAAAVVVLALVVGHFLQAQAAPGGTVYLLSVCGLYGGLLWAVHERRLGLALALTTASALFHAVEYLAVVSWSVRGRSGDRAGVLRFLVPRWGAVLTAFVLALGAGGWLLEQRWADAWLTVNVVVAFLHYAYDGLIWRGRTAS